MLRWGGPGKNPKTCWSSVRSQKIASNNSRDNHRQSQSPWAGAIESRTHRRRRNASRCQAISQGNHTLRPLHAAREVLMLLVTVWIHRLKRNRRKHGLPAMEALKLLCRGRSPAFMPKSHQGEKHEFFIADALPLARCGIRQGRSDSHPAGVLTGSYQALRLPDVRSRIQRRTLGTGRQKRSVNIRSEATPAWARMPSAAPTRRSDPQI